MRVCSNCQHENEDSAVFCEECGQKLSSPAPQPLEEQQLDSDTAQKKPEPQIKTTPIQPEKPVQQKPPKNGNTGLIVTLVVLIGMILGALIFFIATINGGGSAKNSGTPESTSTTVSTSTLSSSISNTTASSSSDSENYDDLIQNAKKMTIAEKYEESELELANIPVSFLNKPENAAINEVVKELSKENKAGLEAMKTSESKKMAENRRQDEKRRHGTTFTGDFAKWANQYTFFFIQESNKQRTLTIASDGEVTQTNRDGTYYLGYATITNASGDILSYETNVLAPSKMPKTKLIHPNVKITIVWDEGGSQELYGYLSYSDRLALTDGLSKDNGVNEVWISD